MELQEFLKKFLPYYEKKRDITISELRMQCYLSESMKMRIDYTMEWKYFHEALQSFADKICEKQKKKLYEKL